MQTRTRRTTIGISVLAALLLSVSGCSADTDEEQAAPEALSGARIEVTGDLPDHWVVGEEAPVVSVVVYDEAEEIVVDEQVTFRVADGPAVLDGGLFVTETGSDGVASVYGITPSSAGEITLEIATAELVTNLSVEARS